MQILRVITNLPNRSQSRKEIQSLIIKSTCLYLQDISILNLEGEVLLREERRGRVDCHSAHDTQHQNEKPSDFGLGKKN